MFCDRLNPIQRGLVCMILGLVLLFHTLGVFESFFYYVLILISLVMIVSGFIQAGLYGKIVAMIQQRKQTPPKM
ncbi:MAG TPA: hypothetical protein VLG71_02125 [Candidatus Limnocylindria bacterium]|nr:hypothetical protein [Candidatus Limnocylindria bacterium]